MAKKPAKKKAPAQATSVYEFRSVNGTVQAEKSFTPEQAAAYAGLHGYGERYGVKSK